jgi:cytochrome c oxidase subunit 2
VSIKNIIGVVVLLAGVLGIGAVFADTLSENQSEQVIKVNAHKFEFLPGNITLKKGVPVILELTSSDVIMGFNAPDLQSRATIIPGVVTRIRVVPDKVGTFIFFCDVFCGDGHEDMSGTITVV